MPYELLVYALRGEPIRELFNYLIGRMLSNGIIITLNWAEGRGRRRNGGIVVNNNYSALIVNQYNCTSRLTSVE